MDAKQKIAARLADRSVLQHKEALASKAAPRFGALADGEVLSLGDSMCKAGNVGRKKQSTKQ